MRASQTNRRGQERVNKILIRISAKQPANSGGLLLAIKSFKF